MQTKRCAKCNADRPIADFNKKGDRYQALCKTHQAEYNRLARATKQAAPAAQVVTPKQSPKEVFRAKVMAFIDSLDDRDSDVLMCSKLMTRLGALSVEMLTAPREPEPVANTIIETPTELAIEPTEPAIEPTEPVIEPTEPIIEPTELAIEPTEPAIEPTEPVIEPTEPVIEPTEPIIEPTEPAIELAVEHTEPAIETVTETPIEPAIDTPTRTPIEIEAIALGMPEPVDGFAVCPCNGNKIKPISWKSHMKTKCHKKWATH